MSNLIQKPTVTINVDNTILTLHTCCITDGKLNLNKAEACLLLIELMKFIEK